MADLRVGMNALQNTAPGALPILTVALAALSIG